MLFKRILAVSSLAMIGFLTGSASAASNGVPPGWNSNQFDASIVAIDRRDRTITVRFQKNDEMETYPVAKNAEFYYSDGEMNVPKSFTDLMVGDTVMLEFKGVKGTPTLSKVTSKKEHVYEVRRR